MSDTDKPMTVVEAGRKGGETVRDQRGREYYVEIGRQGGAKVCAERGREFYAAIGRKGGNAAKAAGLDYAALGKQGGKAAHAKHPDLAKRAGAKAGAMVKEAMALLKAQKERKP